MWEVAAGSVSSFWSPSSKWCFLTASPCPPTMHRSLPSIWKINCLRKEEVAQKYPQGIAFHSRVGAHPEKGGDLISSNRVIAASSFGAPTTVYGFLTSFPGLLTELFRCPTRQYRKTTASSIMLWGLRAGFLHQYFLTKSKYVLQLCGSGWWSPGMITTICTVPILLNSGHSLALLVLGIFLLVYSK